MESPYLTLVDPHRDTSHDDEFVLLPFYPFDQRPETLELDSDEAATAIHLGGDLQAAADLLKVPSAPSSPSREAFSTSAA